MSTPRQAVVLAAGAGRRLAPLTDTCPKPLVPFLNVPLLAHVLQRLADGGVQRVVLNAFHHAGQLVDFAARAPVPGLQVDVVVEAQLLGTGGGLAHAALALEPGPLFVLAGDIVTDVDLEALARCHRASGALATMTLAAHADIDAFGAVDVDPSGRLTDIVGRLARPGATRRVNASVHLVEREFLARLPTDRPACLVRDGYLPWMAAGAHCGGYVHHGAWHETGTPSALLAGQRLALEGRLPVDPACLARGGAVLPGPALVHERARVESGARLTGGTTVGAEAHVASGALLHGCLVLPGARVPPGARRRDEIILPESLAPIGVSES